MMRHYRQKLYLNFLKRLIFLIIIPFLFILSFLIYFSNKTVEKKALDINEQLSSQILYNLSQNIHFAENTAKVLLQNQRLIDFFATPYHPRTDLAYYNSEIYHYVKISNGLASDFRLRIYLENETIPIGYNTFYHLTDLTDFEPIMTFYYQNNDTLWLDGSMIKSDPLSAHKLTTGSDYCFLQKITHEQKTIGLIIIQMPKKLLNNLSLSPIASTNFETTSPPSYTLQTGKDYLLYNFTKTQPTTINFRQLNKKTTDHGTIYQPKSLPGFPFKIIIATTTFDKFPLLYSLILLLVLFISFSLILFVRYTSKIIHDINDCLDGMNQSIDHQFNSLLDINRQDEISVIATRINYLLKRIRVLIDQNVKQQLVAKESQLIALQHQINPHFLYNTMEVFSSRMELAGLYSESEAIVAFSQILRYNINSDSMLTTINEELQQVENYLRIQSLRRVTASLEIEATPVLRQHKIIRFILQPFIENSVKYRHPNQPLTIRIKLILSEKEQLRFIIQDNGSGLSSETLHHLNQRFRKQHAGIAHTDKEIGLTNINERLKLFYGQSHFIQASMQDNWTTFTFTINPYLSKIC